MAIKITSLAIPDLLVYFFLTGLGVVVGISMVLIVVPHYGPVNVETLLENSRDT